ncbi:MAG: nuclear transport factor 2 family protein [Actinobacteria bacterium]|nr:nuclear transport factor 2 family protein [Actinomycetota bacterium]
MSTRGDRCRAGLSAGLAVAALALLMANATACGGSAATATSGGSTPQATPSVAVTPQRLVGDDSVAVTKKAIDAVGAGLEALSGAQVAPLYADELVYDDFTFGLHLEGKADGLKELRRSMGEATGVRVLAGYADSGWGVLEHRWDFTKVHDVSIQPITLFELSGGKIVHEEWWYQDPFGLPNGTPLEPKPLTAAPGPADTPAASKAVALTYAAALQNKDAAAVAALSAPTIAFTDTASSTVGSSPDDVQRHYAKIFETPADLAFAHPRYVVGRGWAAVIWTACSQSYGASGSGVTMLEIRDGAIARETLYYNGSNVPF